MPTLLPLSYLQTWLSERADSSSAGSPEGVPAQAQSTMASAAVAIILFKLTLLKSFFRNWR